MHFTKKGLNLHLKNMRKWRLEVTILILAFALTSITIHAQIATPDSLASKKDTTISQSKPISDSLVNKKEKVLAPDSSNNKPIRPDSIAKTKTSTDSVLVSKPVVQIKPDSVVVKKTEIAKPDSVKKNQIKNPELVNTVPADTTGYDKIVRRTGEILYVRLISKNLYDIQYTRPGDNLVRKISTANVKEIRFANGKVELIYNNLEKNLKTGLLLRQREIGKKLLFLQMNLKQWDIPKKKQ